MDTLTLMQVMNITKFYQKIVLMLLRIS